MEEGSEGEGDATDAAPAASCPAREEADLWIPGEYGDLFGVRYRV